MKILDIPQSGKRGLNVSQAGQFGQISRALAIPSNPRTPAQMTTRGILTNVSARAQVGSADTSGASFRRQRAAFSTPKLDQRNAARLFLQRRGYVSVLEGVLRDDPIDAILCYIRMRLHLEFSLPHDVLVEYEPIVRPPKRNDGVPVCVLIRSWNLRVSKFSAASDFTSPLSSQQAHGSSPSSSLSGSSPFSRMRCTCGCEMPPVPICSAIGMTNIRTFPWWKS